MSTGATACTAFQFFFEQAEAERATPRPRNAVVASTGGPQLGWQFALDEALRERARRRGDVGWRGVRRQSVVPVSKGRSRAWTAHVLVTTTLGDRLEVWVKPRFSDRDGV